jgi:hypothetical protein
MQIAEMRSALEADYVKSPHARYRSQFPESMPDWAVRNIFERRNGLPLTPLPRGVEVRSASSIMQSSRVERAKAIVQEHEARKKITVTDEADRDLARLRLAVASLL